MTLLRTAVIALVLAAPVTARAQEPAQAQEPELVDRVVAVVGDSAILASDIAEQIERRRAMGQPIPTDPAALDALRRQELDMLVNEMVLLQAAQRDSIIVTDADVQAQVNATLTEQERRFGGRAALEAALAAEGTTLEAYRRTVAEGVRRAGIRQQYQARIQRDRRPPPVRESEVREFFEARRGELGRRPATIEFEQLVVKAAPSDSARAAALAEAEQALAELRDGQDFAAVARRFSDDPGTREQGGELGWFRRGRMVPEFERAAYALRPGQVSGIVETAFGFHIIRVDRVRGPERLARHILIRPEITQADQARTRGRAEEVAAALRSGASLDSLATLYHDPAEQSRVGPVLQDSLPAPYVTELRGRAAGEVVGPFRVPGTGEAFAVARVENVTSAGEYTYDDEDLRAQIRSFLQREKLMEEVLGELRDRTYIDIRY
jgi:peptidyl-prolyl cis-trans isomerase SurA